jgi:hypothetical protein
MEGKYRGMLYDAIYIPDAITLDTTDTFAGHTWVNMTSNNAGPVRGGVWVATS